MSRSTKHRVWRLVAPDAQNRTGRRLESAALALASLNVIAVVFQSVDSLYDTAPLLFDGFATASVFLFTVLYVVRLWAAATTDDSRETDGRLRFVRRPFVLLDFVVIVVFWLGVLTQAQPLGSVRVLWIARFFDLPRFRRSRLRFKRVLDAQREDLTIAFSGAGMLVLVSSTLMFFVERTAQPEAFGSIPDALWWGIVTLTTVGYGDVVPVTPLGRLFGAITTFGGVAFFALPSSILAAGFFAEREYGEREPRATDESETAERDDPAPSHCPHCGESLDEAGATER